MRELPGTDFDDINTTVETDLIIFVKELGILFVEIKTSSSEKNIQKAVEQLKNIEAFTTEIVEGIARSTSTTPTIIPMAKIIIVPDEQQPSPSSKVDDCFVFYEDALNNLPTKWKDVLNELKQNSSANFYM